MGWDKELARTMSPAQRCQAMRAAAAWGDLPAFKGLLALKTDPMDPAPSNEEAVWIHPAEDGRPERRVAKKIYVGDCAMLIAAREGHARCLDLAVDACEASRRKPMSFLGPDGADAAMAAAGSKAPGAEECLANLLARSSGWAQNKIYRNSGDGATRRAAKAGNERSLALLAEELKKIPTSQGGHVAELGWEMGRSDHLGRAPLHWALASGILASVELCANATPTAVFSHRDKSGRGLLMCAAESGGWTAVDQCVAWAKAGGGEPLSGLGLRDAAGLCPLDIASGLGALDACKALWRATPADLREDTLQSARAAAEAAKKGHVSKWLAEEDAKLAASAPPSAAPVGLGLASAAQRARQRLALPPSAPPARAAASERPAKPGRG